MSTRVTVRDKPPIKKCRIRNSGISLQYDWINLMIRFLNIGIAPVHENQTMSIEEL